MRCTRYVNVGRTHARLNGEPLEEVDCFKNIPLARKKEES